jgi:hypothetical protein
MMRKNLDFKVILKNNRLPGSWYKDKWPLSFKQTLICFYWKFDKRLLYVYTFNVTLLLYIVHFLCHKHESEIIYVFEYTREHH